MLIRNSVNDIRTEFKILLNKEKFVQDKSGSKVIEILNANFVADESAIFGKPNEEYIARELQWYNSMSRNVNDIPGKVPVIWKQVATPEGLINSNYGWAIYSSENSTQFTSCLDTLVKDISSRRATMIYNRPSMQYDYNKDGMSDFMCTFATQHFVRNGQLNTVVSMRSNDAIFGFPNDFAWFKHVHEQLLVGLNNRLGTAYGTGKIYWNAGSLHVYSRHFSLING
jgi:thymidylate synthase